MVRLGLSVSAFALIGIGVALTRPYDIELTKLREVHEYVRNVNNPRRARFGIGLANGGGLLLGVLGVIGIVGALADL